MLCIILQEYLHIVTIIEDMDSLPNMPFRGCIPVKSAVPGISVFAPAPEKEKLDAMVNFSCPQCGGQISLPEGTLSAAYPDREAPIEQLTRRESNT